MKFRNLLIPLFLIICTCDPPVQEIPEKREDGTREQFLRVNEYLRNRHQDHIEAFVERVGWNMKTSPTGLWYSIDHKGTGLQVQANSTVTFQFSSLLLDGTQCYQTAEGNPKTIILGKGGIESGVEEGLHKMREGDSATFIIPPHLGHGNFGDRNKIPGNTVLIYHLKLTDVR